MWMDKVLSRLTPREKIGMVLAAAAALAAVFVWGFVQPIHKWFQVQAQSIQLERNVVAWNRRILACSDAIQREARQYEEYMKMKGTITEENAEMNGALVALAEQAGVVLVNTKTRDPRDIGAIKEFSEEVEIEGSTNGLVEFLHGAQTSPQLLRVETLTLGLKGGTEASDVLKGTLLITKAVIRTDAPVAAESNAIAPAGKKK